MVQNSSTTTLLAAVLLAGIGCGSSAAQPDGRAVYNGKGFAFAYPASWSRQDLGPNAVNITAPNKNVVFLFGATGDKDLNAVLSEYRTMAASGAWFGRGLKATMNSSPEPLIYGNWMGRAIHGRFNDGDIDVTLIAIEANGQVYILQMLAPQSIGWDASQMLAQFARSLTFTDVPRTSQSQSGSTGTAGCSGCFATGLQHMQNMTSITVNGMK